MTGSISPVRLCDAVTTEYKRLTVRMSHMQDDSTFLEGADGEFANQRPVPAEDPV